MTIDLGNPTWHGANGTSLFGTMRVVATDQHTGRRYRCWCGWKGWTVWGRARQHAESCPLAWLEIPEPDWRYDGQGRQVGTRCAFSGGCNWSSEAAGGWDRWTPATLRRRVEDHYVKAHGGCERCGLPYAPLTGPLSGNPLRFGAVLDAHEGQVCLWVPGITPQAGEWLPPPPGLPAQLRPAQSTFDVAILPNGDLGTARYYHQRRGHDDPEED